MSDYSNEDDSNDRNDVIMSMIIIIMRMCRYGKLKRQRERRQ